MKNIRLNISIFFIIVLLFNYPVFKYGWYVQDDYMGLSWAHSSDWLDGGLNLVNWLFDSQNRFQPIRTLLFTFFTYNFTEKYVILFNLLLHSFNTVLAIYYLKQYNLDFKTILTAAIFFGCSSLWRMIESPSAMLGGDGFIFFCIFGSSYLLRFSFTNYSLNYFGKSFFYFASVLLYSLAIYSYENAFPLIIVLIFSVFYKNNFLSNTKKLLIMIPYFLIMASYLFLFYKKMSGYEGATINLSFDILTRLFYYTLTILHNGINVKGFKLDTELVIILLLVLILINFIFYNSFKKYQINNSLIELLIIGILIYFFGVALFVINSWQSPNNVMTHHLYIPSFGASIIISTFLNYFILRKINIIIYLIIISLFICISYISIINNYTNIYRNAYLVQNLNKAIIDSYDGSRVVIINNYNKFRHNWHPIMSGFDGALQIWKNKYTVSSGTDPIFIRNTNNIEFNFPLSYYSESNKKNTISINDTQFFNLNDNGSVSVITDTYLNNILDEKGAVDINFCNDIFKLNIFLLSKNNNFLKINISEPLRLINNSNIYLNQELVRNFYVDIENNDILIDNSNNNKYSNIRIISKYDINNDLKSINSFNIRRKSDNLLFTKYIVNNQIINNNNTKLEFGKGFYGEEVIEKNKFRWSDSSSEMKITNNTNSNIKINVKIMLNRINSNVTEIKINDNTVINLNEPLDIFYFNLFLMPGLNLVNFKSNHSFKPIHDSRHLSFMLKNICIKEY